ncbi:MAG: hypothetical protein FWC75_06855 [Oscillospiraceae bacterium]|nr:hypothetical protein [Oscillospiraceae bacterium]
MKRKTLFVSIVLHALLLIVVFIFQGMIFPYLRFGGLAPMLLPMVSTGVAVYEGRVTGGVVGIFAGILCDLALNEPVAVFTVTLTLTGLLVGTLADTFITRGFVTYVLFCAGVLVLCAAVQMFPLIYFVGVLPQYLLGTAIWQTIYSLIFAFPIWFFVNAIGKRIYRESVAGRPQ